MSLQIFIASDHAGFELKKQLVEALRLEECDIQDLGPFISDSVDYPDFADRLCQALQPVLQASAGLAESSNSSSDDLPKAFGVLICGSGQGMVMRANRYPSIRAALVYSDEMATLSREHNNANVICLGSRFCSSEQALKWVRLFKKTAFAGGRHQTRVAKVGAPIS